MNSKLNTNVKILIGESLSIDDLNVLSLLYMPIIGSRAYTLYMTMYSALNRSSNTRVVKQSDITDLFGITLNTLNIERKRLEAIGLLNTYTNDSEFVYLLKAPLSARSFFKDGVLAIYLKNRVGDALFEKLVNIFRLESFDKKGYKNVTELFDNVYKDEITEDLDNIDGYFPDKSINSSIKTGDFKFDYDYFVESLNLTLVQRKNLSAQLQMNIENTAYAYNFNEEDMLVVYHRSFDQTGNFSIVKFQREAKLLKKLKEQEKLNKTTVTGIDSLKVIEPVEVLKTIVPNATSEQYELIERVSAESPFDLGVTNVIIMHVLNKNDKICPSLNYFKKTFETFKSKNINNFDDAIKFVKAQGTYEKKEDNKENKDTKKKETTTSGGSEWLENFKKQFK